MGPDGPGGLAHEANKAAALIIEARRHDGKRRRPAGAPALEGDAMTLLLLEALGALVLLVFIVWWTMFSGRQNGELKRDAAPDPDEQRDRP